MTARRSRHFELTPADHEHFIRHGFLILRGVVPLPEVTSMLEVLAREGNGADVEEARKRAMKSMAAGALMKAISDLHGPAYPVTSTRVSSMPRPLQAGATPSIGPHIDLIHPTFVPDDCAVTALVFLTPVRNGGGTFFFSPGSPARLRAYMSRYSCESAWGVTKSEAIAGSLEELLAEPGDAILFQHLMLHAGSKNLVDPTTRQAIRVEFRLSPRLSNHRKAVGDMSTIEKANSPRYLRDHLGHDVHLMTAGQAEDQLSIGFGPVLTHATITFGGNVHRFWTTVDEPAQVRRAVTRDFATWSVLPSLDLVAQPITSMHLEHRFNPTLTLVCREGERSCSRVFESTDLTRWRQIVGAPGWTISRPHFIDAGTDPLMSRIAFGSIVYFATDERPNVILWRCGGNREEVTTWRTEGLAHIAPSAVTDLWALPGTEVNAHVLVVDVDGVAHYTCSGLQDEFLGPLLPFQFAGGTVNQLRVFERAQGYWLLTYRRGTQVLWGEIDWTERPGVIVEVTNQTVLRARLELVGRA